jgi:hypothetical protein
VIRVPRARQAAALLIAALAVTGCSTSPYRGADFPPPPRYAPVNSPVTVSAGGRVITARGVIACGHRPLLVARSHPDRVTLTWVNPDTNCNAEAIKPVTVSVSLPAPLGTRKLVQASTGKPIRHRTLRSGTRVSAAPVPCRPGWHVASGAAPAGDRWDRLVAIAGSASDDVWAVGDRLPDPRHVFPLLEHWDGRRWAYSAGAPLGGRQAHLTSVAALSSDDVWAVGNFASVGPAPPAPLIEHWNGRSWSLQPTHALTRLKSALPYTVTSVAALAPDDVWVLGTPGSNSSDVYVHWNGTSWTLFRGPKLISPRLGSAAMQVIATDHRGRLWAAGGWVGPGETGFPRGGIVERWTGRRWQVDRHAAWKVPLTMVAPVAPDDVWAIAGGSFTTAGTYGISPVQVLHWNGSTWKVELSSGGAGSVFPTGLAAVSADDAYVTGQDTATRQPFIKHWDGTRWRSLPLGPAGHIQRLSHIRLTVTAEGSIAALDTPGQTARANLLWLRCQH